MVFSIIIILLLALVAFFHFVQGFFSATLSAIIAVLAAVLAVSYDETVVNLLFKAKVADSSHALVLCLIFAAVYLVLRVIFDAAIPGNVRTPATFDKAGAALMGIVAGIFVTGIFAIAVQMLPFDPGISFLGYSRYSLHAERDVVVPNDRQSIDSKIFNEMDDASLVPDKQQHLIIPVDDWVLDTVYHLSNEGSLAGDRPLASVHPDYLQELFGERLGIQTGARRVALHVPSNPTIDIGGVYSVPSLPVRDGQIKDLRASGYTPLYRDVVKPNADQRILVVRVKAGGGATDDEDSIFRFSTGSIHIVGKTADGYQDFYPIGTLENQNTVLLNKPDDFLFVKGDGEFDAVFVVDSSLLVTGADADHVAPETFISVKRFAKLDLSGMEVKKTIPGDPGVQVIHNTVLLKALKLLPPPPPAAVSTDSQRTADSGQPTVFGSFSFVIPQGWRATTPQRDKTKAMLLLNGSSWADADGLIQVDAGVPVQATARDAAAFLAGADGKVNSSPMSVDGANGYWVDIPSQDLSRPKAGVVVFRGGMAYSIMAAAKPDVDVSAALRQIVSTWKWQ